MQLAHTIAAAAGMALGRAVGRIFIRRAHAVAVAWPREVARARLRRLVLVLLAVSARTEARWTKVQFSCASHTAAAGPSPVSSFHTQSDGHATLVLVSVTDVVLVALPVRIVGIQNIELDAAQAAEGEQSHVRAQHRQNLEHGPPAINGARVHLHPEPWLEVQLRSGVAFVARSPQTPGP